jgi:aldehyde:ferredoxin oxidoreductase
MKANVIEVDLATGGVKESLIDASLWLGGRGLAVKLFVDRCEPGCDPLGAGNVFVLATSPLTGTAAPTAGRGHMVFKSPLTGTIGSANSGGRFGKVLKSAGVDALVFTGQSPRPVYIAIADEGDLAARVRVLPADDLWGKTVPEASDLLAARHGGKDASVLATGPAGERLVRFAALMNEHNRAYGRGGPGAVLGAKKVKAIVVSGRRKTEVAEPERFKDAIDQVRHNMKAVPATKRVLHDLGTAGLVHLIDLMAMLPHRNFQDATHVPALLKQISGEQIRKQILERAGGCFGCPILCQRHTRIGDKRGEGPEYETVVLMGPAVDVYDLEPITLGNYLANELGLDTISLGGTLACAAELFEKGALTAADFGGEAVRFGDAQMYPEIVGRIGAREGLGDLLAEGSLRLAKQAGRPELAMQVKGLELPAYDPRGMLAQALGFMTSPTGGCHLRGGYCVALAFFGGIREVPRFSARQAAITAKNQQDIGIVQDALGICRFTGYAVGLEHWARVFGAVIGQDINRADLEHSAERVAALERLFNLRAGLSRADDTLPPRFRDEAIVIDGRERRVTDSECARMLNDYYLVRGWDEEGAPTKETMEKLKL